MDAARASDASIQSARWSSRMSLTILYEDEALLFVDKPPGLVVQRGYDADEPVLIDEVQQYLARRTNRPF